MRSLISLLFQLNCYLILVQCTSIALDRRGNFSQLTEDEIYSDVDPYMSMEDLASKEKIIVNATPFHIPDIILRPVSSEEVPPEEIDSPETSDTDSPEESEEGESSSEDTAVPTVPTTTTTTTEASIILQNIPVTSISSSPTKPTIVSPSEDVNSRESQAQLELEELEKVRYSPEYKHVPGSSDSESENGRLTYTQPMPVKSQIDQDIDEKLFLILQNSVRETYYAFRDMLGTRHRTQLSTLEDDLRMKLNQLDVDLNVKVVALDTTTHSRIQTLTDQIIDQRKEDIQTFSDNLHQLQKTHQMHIDSQKVEIQQLQVTMELLNKAQSSLSTKISQLQKTVNNLDSKVNEMVIKSSEDLGRLKDGQKTVTGLVDEMQLDLKTNEAEFRQMQEIVRELQKASTEDNGKLRRTLIRDQKQEPIQNSIRHLRNKNVGAALKHWRAIEAIADDLKETLPADMSKIIDESYGKNAANLVTVLDFVHRAVSHGDKRLKESAYGSLLQEMDPSKQLTDQKKTIEIFNLAQTMKSDIGNYYNSSTTTAEIVGKLPEIIKLITFDKVKLQLPTKGYLRVAADRKVTLVSPEGRFYDKDEILWQFEYDKDKTDGTFYIKSDKLQKYLVTLHEGFNSYGFSKQGLFVTGNKKENGTRFQMTIVNHGEYVLLKSVFYNGYLSWKSNIQTIYGDDDSYFLLLVDRKNGPSPYWNIEAENGY